MSDKGTCEKHGEFILAEGCPQCLADLAERNEGDASPTPRFKEKLKVLKSLETKELTERMYQYEEELEKTMLAEANFKAQNRSYLGSGDCQEVKILEAELITQAPEVNESGKKLTISDKENWLLRQRTESKELSEAITRQREVSFLVDNNQISTDMAKRRLEGTRAVLALKTQQLAFLAS